MNTVRTALFSLILIVLGGSAFAEPVRGAGSTFAFPVIAKWSQSYLEDKAGDTDYIAGDTGVDYEPVGSLGGILRLQQPEIDFAATDAPLPPAELAKFGYVQFPIVIGGIAPVVNIPGVGPGKLRLTGAVAADIYLGKVQNWSDPALKAINPDATLPDLRITVVHRSDGSGSTFNWTSFLSVSSADWKAKYGADTLISWPLGTGVEGGGAMAEMVKATDGAIGYLEFGQVARAALNFAQMQNRAGNFVSPEPAAFQAAASEVDWGKTNDFYVSLIDAGGDRAYPITAATFAVMRANDAGSSRLRQTLWFFGFALERGGADAAALGYVPLPDPLVRQVRGYWLEKFKFGS